MKIAIISDIHGNLPALQAVTEDIEAWRPDIVVVDGDIVNRGPLSLDCLRMIQEKQQTRDWQVVRGNHEDYLIACSRPNFPKNGPEYEIVRFADWAFRQLNGDVASLKTMPDQWSIKAPDGSELRVTHASMQNNRDGIFVKADDEKLRQQIAPPPAVFVTAHTHHPLVRRIDDTLVANVGSVGFPFDEDRRLSYGRFAWTRTKGWQTKIARLQYDRGQVERDFVSSGFLEEAGPLAQLVLVELRKARGLIYRWATQYEEAVKTGEISMEESVRELLSAEDVRPFLGAPGWVL